MSVIIDTGPCQVRGMWTGGRARVVWENGVLYVATGLHSVTRFDCPDPPRAPTRDGGWYVASTTDGDVEFRRRGCTCSYGVGRYALAKLVRVAQPLRHRATV